MNFTPNLSEGNVHFTASSLPLLVHSPPPALLRMTADASGCEHSSHPSLHRHVSQHGNTPSTSPGGPHGLRGPLLRPVWHTDSESSRRSARSARGGAQVVCGQLGESGACVRVVGLAEEE
eukprot:764850-Hanusia_phi.AAC.11